MTGNHTSPPRIVEDLVGYTVLMVPDFDALGVVVPALGELAGRGLIRILDLAVVVRDADGSVSALEVDTIESLDALREVEGEYGRFLTDRDLEQVGVTLEPSTAGFVIVTEDTWAEPLSTAVHAVGGAIVAGERIPAARLHAAFVERGAVMETGS
jgi:Family of unknown function (DUF6325)